MRSKQQKQISSVFKKFKLLSRKTKSTGWTEFAPLKVVPEYINVNVKTKKVRAIVRYRGTAHLTVDVDIAAGKTKVHGSLRGIKRLIKPFKKRDYVKMIEDEARFLVGVRPLELDDRNSK